MANLFKNRRHEHFGMKLLLSVVALGVYGIVSFFQGPTKPDAKPEASDPPLERPLPETQRRGSAIDEAFANRRSNVQVQGEGKVTRILPDDHEGSRHQKFLIRIPSGLTVLMAHNIDLAPRVEKIAAGDAVEFQGEYEWSAKGGVIHWTHRDPAGRHAGGWIRHEGRIYQ
jgi:hypothetical protein